MENLFHNVNAKIMLIDSIIMPWQAWKQKDLFMAHPIASSLCSSAFRAFLTAVSLSFLVTAGA